jgi:diketogulonate reductase-like aldo/keto reductase
MGLRTKEAAKIEGRYPLVLVGQEEVERSMIAALTAGYRFLDMSAVGDATGRIRVALLFEKVERFEPVV